MNIVKTTAAALMSGLLIGLHVYQRGRQRIILERANSFCRSDAGQHRGAVAARHSCFVWAVCG